MPEYHLPPYLGTSVPSPNPRGYGRVGSSWFSTRAPLRDRVSEALETELDRVRKALIEDIKRDQAFDKGEVAHAGDLPNIFIEHFVQNKGERLRVKVPKVQEGWLSDTALFPMMNEEYVILVIDGRAYQVPLAAEVVYWPDWEE